MTESDGIKIDENNKEADTKSVNEEGSKSDDKRKQTISEQEIKFLLAAAHCDYEVVNSLLSKNPELLDTRTALHYACKFGEVSILMCLAGNYKANVDWITHGQTPLHVAVVFGQEEIVRLLLSKYNADKTKRDYSGRKPVDCASSQNLSDMEKILGLQDYKVVQKQKEDNLSKPDKLSRSSSGLSDFNCMSMRVLSAPKKLFQGNKKDSTDMSFSSLSSFNSSGSNSNSNLGASHSFRHTGSNGAQSSSTTSTGLLSLGANQARSQPGRSSSTMLPSPSPGGKHQSWVGNFIKPSTPKSAK